MTLSPAAQALNAWCDAERGRAAALSAALGVTPTTVHNWRRGAIVPRAEGPDNRGAIEAHTGGAVPAVGWADDPADDTRPAPASGPVVDRSPEFSQAPAGEVAA
jgi:hypothetical protein